MGCCESCFGKDEDGPVSNVVNTTINQCTVGVYYIFC